MQENNEVMNTKQSKFKVGDKVRILRKDTTFGWYEDMEDSIGQEVTIDYAREGYTEGVRRLKFGYGIDGWMWSEEVLELISEPTEQSQPKEQTYTESRFGRLLKSGIGTMLKHWNPYSWMSDEYAIVEAESEEDALSKFTRGEYANPQPNHSNR